MVESYNSPLTRESLIIRLPSAADAEAWQEFVAIYEPHVYRFARRRGLQDADAHELVQNVFLSVAKAVGGWKPDPDRGKFRAWLFRIARNHVINLARKRKPDQGTGRTDEYERLQQLCDQVDSTSVALEQDYRRELFRTAAAEVRVQVKPQTWEAFWLSSVEGKPIAEVAEQLSVSAGSIYIARSRVIHRMRSLIQSWEAENE